MKTYPLAYQNQHQQQQQQQSNLQYKLKQQCKKDLLQHLQQHKQKQQKKHKVCKKETDVALVVGRSAWWIPVLATNNNMRNLTFAEALKDFLQNFSFHCYGKLVETGRRYHERLFWLIFHVAALSALIIFLWDNRNTGGQLLKTTIHDSLQPMYMVPFPAVSVCSINRISNASATRYAEELNSKDTYKRGVQYFYEQIKMLQYNYFVPNGRIRNYYKALRFQNFLDSNDRDDTELFYDTRKRMASLTPNCSDILVECRLGSTVINCAEEFKETFTARGLCCSFNNDNKYSVRGFRTQFSGQTAGLILLLNAPQNDNFYNMLKLNGFMISIHSPSFYPVQISGGIEEHVALTGISTYFSLTASVHQTASETRFLGPKARNCLFGDERPKLYDNDYTFNICISLCRIRSMIVLCGCMPFHAPYEKFTIPMNAAFCSLQHNECLMHYKFKWSNVITERPKIHGLEREMEESLYCPDCLPSCSENIYNAQILELPLNEYTMQTFPEYKENYSDLALVRIYLAETNAIFLKQILTNSWFEILSSVGSICGVIAGFSLIGVCEIVFFIVKQIVSAYKNEVLQDGNHRKATAGQNLIILP